MKTIMIVIGYILLLPIIALESLLKICWAIIFSICIPILKNLDCYYSMECYAYKWRGEFRICNKILNLWD